MSLLSREDTIATPTCSTAYVASAVVSAVRCVVRSVAVQLDPDLAAGNYWVLVMDAPACPNDGNVAAQIVRAALVVHADDTAEIVNFSGALSYTEGCVVALSSTGPGTLTIETDGMIVMGDVL